MKIIQIIYCGNKIAGLDEDGNLYEWYPDKYNIYGSSGKWILCNVNY